MSDARQPSSSGPGAPAHLQQQQSSGIQRPSSAPAPAPGFGGSGSSSSRDQDGRALFQSTHGAAAGAKAQPTDAQVQAQASSNPQRFLGWAKSLVKDRKGQILSRNMILKTDHYPSGRATEPLEFSLAGAPNFRGVPLNIYGTAQPKLGGLRTILSVLSCFPHAADPRQCTWVSTRDEPMLFIGGRSYVLRDSEQPFESIALTARASQLEEIEERLKEDVLREGRQRNGCVLVHEELPGEKLVASWLAADEVKTAKELFESVRHVEGYMVTYHRIPIGILQDEGEVCDRYLSLIRSVPLDEALVFNCGMGRNRSTFAMAAALLVRRRQVLIQEHKDPLSLPGMALSKSVLEADPHVLRALDAGKEEKAQERSLLFLMGLLQTELSFNKHSDLIEVLTTQPKLMDDLKHALGGRYELVLQLLSVLENGPAVKSLVDHVVNLYLTLQDETGDAVINLRTLILSYRLRCASNAPSHSQKHDMQRKGLNYLERYFYLIAFGSFLESWTPESSHTFAQFIKRRDEICNMIYRLRNSQNLRMYAPAVDLSALSRSESGQSTSEAATTSARLAATFNELVGQEWAQQLVKNRRGITLRAGSILKRDIWSQTPQAASMFRGANNFRRIECLVPLFATGQPTEKATGDILQYLEENGNQHVRWLNLREEPLIYINGSPYVLRDEVTALRNNRSFAGISGKRLELLEDRLKSDIINELKTFDGKLLCHQEQDDGSVVPVWEGAQEDSIKTLREMMEGEGGKDVLQFHRLPLTPERPPDFADIEDLLQHARSISADDAQDAVVVNDQLGSGRATLVSIILSMAVSWRKGAAKKSIQRSGHQRPYSFQSVNTLLRLAHDGPSVKSWVDKHVDLCREPVDLLEGILECRRKAEKADPSERKKFIAQGLVHLRRYWWLMLLGVYFHVVSPDGHTTFRHFYDTHPVLKTLWTELSSGGLNDLRPLGKHSDISDSDEMRQAVASRSGGILTAGSILKADLFPGLAKRLDESVDGAPNYRRLDILQGTPNAFSIFGTGMPSLDGGYTGALIKMGAGPNGDREIVWTSMREEPVCYIQNKPYVLRILDDPFENVVYTGVRADTVQQMEESLRNDILREASARGGEFLIHDEVDDGSGAYVVAGTWITLSPEDVLTPKEAFEQLQREGYKVDYERLPITDEQSPLAEVFGRVEERVTDALQKDNAAVAFNCQMGRGRTTAGQIMAALVAGILAYPGDDSASATGGGEPMTPIEESPIAQASSMVFGGKQDSDAPADAARQQRNNNSWDGDRENIYLNGEYKAILQLIAVLRKGKLAKRLTDQAIDSAAAVQNLRKAVYDYKLRADAAEPGSSKQKRIQHVGENYLYRYGMLIAFCAYLLERRERSSNEEKVMSHKSGFPEWVREHSEVKTILQRAVLE